MTITQAQIAERMNYLGASDCAGALGLSRWDSPLKVWARKTGSGAPDEKNRIAAWLGNQLEEAVAKLFEMETGKKVHRVQEAYIHKTHKFLRCHIDRKVIGERAILQCKTADVTKAYEWGGEEVPQEYILQELHELACTSYDRAYVAVLIGNRELRIKTIERDDKVIAEVVKREIAFWKNCVVARAMPTNIKKQDSDTLFALFPHGDEGDPVALGQTADAMMDTLEALQKDHYTLKGDIEKAKNEIKAMLGAASWGKSSGWRVSWRNQDNRELDAKGLKRDHPEIYAQYLQNRPTRVLRYSRRGRQS